ncbi:MAG: PocR ligand-binding domain-containing protein [Clostridia bacterium]|nr:PocR ligand-binding domain-containing protein [Clostridia bacterium]
MLLRYNLEKLKKVIDDFHRLTGISISIADTEFHHLVRCRAESPDSFCKMIQSTPEGLSRCGASDCALLSECRERRAPCTHLCHAGLADTCVPIIDDGVILGYVIFGQVCDSPLSITHFSEIYPRVRDLGLDRDQLEAAYSRILFVDQESIESASELVNILTKYIWLEHMIRRDDNDVFETIAEYIVSHLGQDLEIGALCKQFNLSKNALYKLFHKNAGCTVNEYVTARRIAAAKRLLKETTLAVYLICEAVGIENYQYFCRVFKRVTGISPLQYRKKGDVESVTPSFQKGDNA